jgi:mRNA export factor
MSFSPQGQPTADYLAVSSWDNNVRVYEISNTGQSKGIAMYSHQAPALCVMWSPDGSKIISGGCDNAARMYDVNTGQSTQVAQHEQPIKAVSWVNIPAAPDCHLVTGSWDKTLKYWDMRSPNPIASVTLPERLYSMDTAGQYLVAACADRQNVVYNLQDPSKPYKVRLGSPAFCILTSR